MTSWAVLRFNKDIASSFLYRSMCIEVNRSLYRECKDSYCVSIFPNRSILDFDDSTSNLACFLISISGAESLDWSDLFYFSAVTYTSTGYGDLTPTDNLRLLATIEALTGLIMIAWTASFAFLVMQRYWQEQDVKKDST